jgi:hypothetical protein
MVLRHELGHNFGSVGEEYDGGSAYFGANFASTTSAAESKWRAWLSEVPIVVQDAQLRVQDYPWYLLENGPRTYSFTSSGTYKRWYLSFTASGCPEQGALGVYLDGVPLEIDPPGTEDRTFYKFLGGAGFSQGQHELRFREENPPTGSFKRQLCSVTLHEYMDDPLFHWEEYYSAYKTWRLGNTLVGYRPTNEYCLMRNMTSPNFCKICQENMWLQFFQTVSAIDNITKICDTQNVDVKLNVIPLAQFRPDPIIGELYELTWYKNDVEQPDYRQKFEWKQSRSESAGTWKAILRFISPQVRQDPNLLMTFEAETVIVETGPCN